MAVEWAEVQCLKSLHRVYAADENWVVTSFKFGKSRVPYAGIGWDAAVGRGCVRLLACFALVWLCPHGTAQGFWSGFHSGNAEMRKVQPTWMTPLVGTTPLLGQFVREEFVRQRMPDGKSVWSIGNGKGLSLLVGNRMETDLSIPNYVVHGAEAGTDGAGDFCFTARVRMLSGNAEHGNYAVTAVLSQTWSTGLEKNGAETWTRGVTLSGGKAFGRFAVLSSLGATIPATKGLAAIGRPIGWNSAAEMHLVPRVWAQFESNATFYRGGTHDGMAQHYVTPGLFLAPLRPWSATSKSFILLGAGMQFATTHYHTSDHNLVIDTKIYF